MWGGRRPHRGSRGWGDCEFGECDEAVASRDLLPNGTMPESDDAPAVSPLIAAAKAGDLPEFEKVESLSDAAQTTDEDGRTALSFAAAGGHLKMVKALLAVKAPDSTVAGWTAMHHAAFGGHEDVIVELLAADSKSAAPVGLTVSPLLLAAGRGHLACVERIVDAAPESIAATDTHGRTALMHAATSGSAEVVQLLAKRGALLNSVSNNGRTALMWAVCAVKPATVGALCQCGAALDVRAPFPPGSAIIPGRDMEKGESALDLANAQHNKNPTLRHISAYLLEWKRMREKDPAEAAPSMPPLPWVAHAQAKAAEKLMSEAAAADTPSGEAMPVTAGESDIFGDDDVAPDEGATNKQKKVTIVEEPTALPVGAGGAANVAALEGDLDDLD
jgi:ankyrin repeat protein